MIRRAVSLRRDGTDLSLTVAGVVCSFLLGWGVSVGFPYSLAALGAPLALVLFQSALGRLVFVAGGGTFVLGSSAELSELKVAYVAGAAVATLIAVLRLPRLTNTPEYDEGRHLVRWSFLYAGFITASALASIAWRGTDAIQVVRDVAPYLLFAAVPVLAIDVGTSAKRWIVPLFLALGTLATASFALEWIGRRGLVDFPIARLTLSGALPAALLSLTVAESISGHRRARWAVSTGLIVTALLATGNRSVLLFVLIPVVIVLSNRRERVTRLARFALLCGALLILTPVLVSLFGRSIGLDPATVYERLASVAEPARLLTSDQSFQVRRAHTQSAGAVFREHQWVGAGPGIDFAWVNPLSGEQVINEFSLDSPLVYPAKFGILGLIVLFPLLGSYARMLYRMLQRPLVPRLALIAYCTTQFVWLVTISSVFEDKGFALGLLFLLALSLPPERQSPAAA